MDANIKHKTEIFTHRGTELPVSSIRNRLVEVATILRDQARSPLDAWIIMQRLLAANEWPTATIMGRTVTTHDDVTHPTSPFVSRLLNCGRTERFLASQREHAFSSQNIALVRTAASAHTHARIASAAEKESTSARCQIAVAISLYDPLSHAVQPTVTAVRCFRRSSLGVGAEANGNKRA